MTEKELKDYFHQIEENFNKAVISNNVDEIKKCVSEDWVLVDGHVRPPENRTV